MEETMELKDFAAKTKLAAIRRYAQNFDSDSIQDLSQQAELLELEAASRFCGRKDSGAFRDYLEKYITGGTAAFTLARGDVYIPAATRAEYSRILKARDGVEELLRRPATAAETAKAAGTGIRAVRNALAAEPLMGPAERIDASDQPDWPDTDSAPPDTDNDKLRARLRELAERLGSGERLMTNLLAQGLSISQMEERTGLSRACLAHLRQKTIRKLKNDKDWQDLAQASS